MNRFVFGNEGDYSTPGGTIRVIGDGIALPSTDSTPSFELGDYEYLDTPTSNKYSSSSHVQSPVPQLYLTLVDSSSSATPPISSSPISAASTVVQLPGTNLTRSHAAFALPSDLPLGIYELAVSSSPSGTIVPLCTFLTPEVSCLSTINITAPPSASWPKQQKFVVEAEQPGYGRNATTAIQKALDAAKKNGGGIIYFPRVRTCWKKIF